MALKLMGNDIKHETPKRVACLYRVSTKGQMLGDDIPMQKRACREFIERNGWVLVKEYIEKGVSGFKVSEKKRDEVQRAKSDAEKRLYDILLVFMFDRLGRKEDETPIMMNWFHKQGIELWSTQEGQQKLDKHEDKLTNYIRFWQSSGESQKTSMRVRENHTQMAEDGIFRGGRPAFGYRLIVSGQKNKKGKELLKPEIVEEQAIIIQEIYNLVDELGYGSNRIAKYLNFERKPFIPSSTGGEWTSGVINFILRNPVYKGYPAYGKRKSDVGVFNMQDPSDWVLSKSQIEELVIIQEDQWNRVQNFRSKRSPKQEGINNYQLNPITKSPLLFVGMAQCGHCGSPLTTTYNRKKYKLASGEEKIWSSPKYRCSGKARGKSCDGQTIYSPNKIETSVLEEIEVYLEQLKKYDFTSEINSFRKKNVDVDIKELNKLQSDLERKYKELSTLTNEVTKALMGESSFSPDLLNSLIEQKDKEIKLANEEYKALENKIQDKKVEVNEMEMLVSYIPKWQDTFNSSSIEKQKKMLNTIVESVTVTRQMVEVNVKLHIATFCSSLNGSETDSLGRAHRWQR